MKFVIHCKSCNLKNIIFREELRGISRGKDAKDVNWSSVASSAIIEVTEKPEPIKISLSDVISRIKKPVKTVIVKNNNNEVEKNSKWFLYRTFYVGIIAVTFCV